LVLSAVKLGIDGLFSGLGAVESGIHGLFSVLGERFVDERQYMKMNIPRKPQDLHTNNVLKSHKSTNLSSEMKTLC